jgi:hypothetical protein
MKRFLTVSKALKFQRHFRARGCFNFFSPSIYEIYIEGSFQIYIFLLSDMYTFIFISFLFTAKY